MTEMRKRINLEEDKSRIFAGENSKRCVHHDSLLPRIPIAHIAIFLFYVVEFGKMRKVVTKELEISNL